MNVVTISRLVARPKQVARRMIEPASILQPRPVRAHAIVDSAGAPEGATPEWRVKVWDDHLGQTRCYEIAANTESEAAMEGLRRFREEMEAPLAP